MDTEHVVGCLVQSKAIITRKRQPLTDVVAAATMSIDTGVEKIPGYRLWAEAKRALCEVLPYGYTTLPQFDHNATKTDVLALFDAAIKHLEASGGR